MLRKQIILLTILATLSHSLSAVKSLKEQAAQAYFSTRSLSAIKADLTNNKLNLELQQALVPLVIKKYKSQLNPQFNKLLQGHTLDILSIALSPDNKYALTGSYDKTARLWDLTTGETIKIFYHTNWVESVAFSSDSRYALTGSWDMAARLWDIPTGQLLYSLTGHSSFVIAVAFSPDCKYALTGSWDNTARLWDLGTGQTIKTLKGHTKLVSSIEFSPDGRYALTGSWDNTVRLWNLETGQTMTTLSHASRIRTAKFSLDGKYVITGSSDKIFLWDITDATREPRVLLDQTEQAVSIALSHNSPYALTVLDNGTARLCNLTHPEAESKTLKEPYSIALVALSSDGQYALTASRDATARLWNLGSCTKNIDLEALINKINRFAIEAPCAIL